MTEFATMLWCCLAGVFLIGLAMVFLARISKSKPRGIFLCARCGYLGEARMLERGGTLLELFLWLLGFVPGLIYNLWRFSTRRSVCAVCESDSLVPLHSARGRELLARYH